MPSFSIYPFQNVLKVLLHIVSNTEFDRFHLGFIQTEENSRKIVEHRLTKDELRTLDPRYCYIRCFSFTSLSPPLREETLYIYFRFFKCIKLDFHSFVLLGNERLCSGRLKFLFFWDVLRAIHQGGFGCLKCQAQPETKQHLLHSHI